VENKECSGYSKQIRGSKFRIRTQGMGEVNEDSIRVPQSEVLHLLHADPPLPGDGALLRLYNLHCQEGSSFRLRNRPW
jgi:hypothetical protein